MARATHNGGPWGHGDCNNIDQKGRNPHASCTINVPRICSCILASHGWIFCTIVPCVRNSREYSEQTPPFSHPRTMHVTRGCCSITYSGVANFATKARIAVRVQLRGDVILILGLLLARANFLRLRARQIEEHLQLSLEQFRKTAECVGL